jgi:hypothetical protein
LNPRPLNPMRSGALHQKSLPRQSSGILLRSICWLLRDSRSPSVCSRPTGRRAAPRCR